MKRVTLSVEDYFRMEWGLAAWAQFPKMLV